MSKKNYLLLVFIFVLIEHPGGLFPTNYWLKLTFGYNSLPSYQLLGFELEFFDFFFATALIKALYWKRQNFHLIFNKPYKILLLYLSFLILLSFMLGFKLSYIRFTIQKDILPITLFFSLPILLKSKEELIKMAKLLFPFLFLGLFFQSYQILTGTKFIELFGIMPEQTNTFPYVEELIRPDSMAYICLYSIIIALFLFSLKFRTINKNYLILVIFFSTFSIFITALRGWIISFGFIIISYLILFALNQKRIFMLSLPIIIISFMLYTYVPLVKMQTNYVLVRLETLELLLKGDLTAGGTNVRLTDRHERIMGKIKENPVTGFGFSNYYYEHRDVHVGNQNIVLNSGIIGYLLFLYLWIFFIRTILKYNNSLSPNNRYKKVLLIFNIAFFGIFIIHSSSSQIFGFDQSTAQYEKFYFLALFFTSVEIFLKDAVRVENNLIKQKNNS